MVKCLKHSLCISNKTWMLAIPTSRTFYREVLGNEVIRKLNKKLKNWKGKKEIFVGNMIFFVENPKSSMKK